MNGEPLDLDAVEAKFWYRNGEDKLAKSLIDECRALRAEVEQLRAENDDLSAIHDDLSEDTARLRAEVERAHQETQAYRTWARKIVRSYLS